MFHKISVIAVLACLLVASLAGSATAGPLRDNFLKAQELRAEAMDSYRAGDMEAALAGMKAILALRPGHPTYLLNVAKLSAKTGDKEGALAALKAYADTGMTADAAGSADFALFRDDPFFQEVVTQLERNDQPVVRSDVALTLDMQTGLTEGITYDAKRDRFIVSSISEGALYTVERDGHTEVLLDVTKDNIPGGFMGVRYDSSKDGLWMTYSALVQVKDIPTEVIGATGYQLMDLETETIAEGAAIMKMGDIDNVLGDLLISDNGWVYATNSQYPSIHVVSYPEGTLSANNFIALKSDFVSLQGIAETPNGGALIVADYALGLLRVELEGGKVTRLPGPPNANLRGIDGLYRYGDGLIGIQNGARPKRIIYVHMNDGWDEVTGVEVIEKAVPEWEEPTLGVIVGDEFYYIANSGWTISGSGPPSAEDLEKRGNVAVRRIDLSKID